MSATMQAVFLKRYETGVGTWRPQGSSKGPFATFLGAGLIFRKLSEGDAEGVIHDKIHGDREFWLAMATWLDVSRPTLMRWMLDETVPHELVQKMVHEKVYGWVRAKYPHTNPSYI